MFNLVSSNLFPRSLFDEFFEALHLDAQVIDAGLDEGDRVVPLIVRLDRAYISRSQVRERNLRAGDRRTRRVSDLTVDGSGGLLREDAHTG